MAFLVGAAGLQQAARGGAGLVILPCYLGEADPLLHEVPMPGAPSAPLWLTVHRDLRKMPRVRAVIDFLVQTMKADAALLGGRAGYGAAGPS